MALQVWSSLKQRISASRTSDVFVRDPEFIVSVRRIFNTVSRYFRADVRGGSNVPVAGPAIIVGNHSGGLYTPEVYVLMEWWLRTHGPRQPLWILAHDLLLGLPVVGDAARRIGCIHASDDNARLALARNEPLVVFPGGEHEAFRPVWKRNQIDFRERKGFIRLALESGTPIVPMVTHGSHHTTIVLARGRRLARWIDLPLLRTRVFPVVVGFPW